MTVKGHLKDDYSVAAFINDRCKGFEYVGNYTGADGRADIKCKDCGAVINRSMISIRKNHFGCPECNARNRILKKKRSQYEHNIRIKTNDCNQFNKNAKQLEYRFCSECGRVFVPRQSNAVRCSKECTRRALNRSPDSRLNKYNVVDWDITLTKLYLRDEGICWLCGKPCDYDDYYVNDNGVTIVGEQYPSIDHVIPLAKGGLHAWSNVKLAHKGCNEQKGDRII